MSGPETIARFILLRSQGCSFNQIATETEALAQRVFGARRQRWERLAGQLKKLEDEIDRRDLEEIPASRLHHIALALRAEIRRLTGDVHFSETTADIPIEERVFCEHDWPG